MAGTALGVAARSAPLAEVTSDEESAEDRLDSTSAESARPCFPMTRCETYDRGPTVEYTQIRSADNDDY